MNLRKTTALYYNPNAMQINNLIKGRGKLSRSKFLGSKVKTCYNCRKVGYIARNCYLKNKVTQQLNVLTINNKGIAKDK